MRISKSAGALVSVGVLLLLSRGAFAASTTCPGTSGTTDREYTMSWNYDTAGTPVCYDYGPGNDWNGGSEGQPEGYVLAAKVEDPAEGTNGALTIVGTNKDANGEFTEGTWELDLDQISQDTVYVVFKTGQGGLDPDWAAFKLEGLADSGKAGGTFSITGDQALSHTSLYTPIPAAAWLFGSALFGIAGIGYRRRRQT